MSNSKHYVLSFTTLFCNKKGYVLMFNRHQNVHHVDNFPLSFEPWNRYSALIMRDMKMGTKVKRATGVLHSALANFKTIFEGNNPDELKKGSLFYLSNLSENLTRSKLNPTYGVADKPDKINDFYAHFGDIIDKVNAQVVRSITLPSDLVKTKIIENGKEILTVEGGLTLANYGDGIGLEILRLLNLEGEESVLEVLALLHQQGYNQAIELADLLFKGGELSTADRLLTIQYGEKAVDMAKANFVKVVLDSLADLLVNGKKIEVVTLDGLPSNFEVFEVVGYGFLDEFQKPHANVKSQEIIEIVDSTKFTDVFNSNVNFLDDAANVKKNIESVGTTTADAVVTYADRLSMDASEKLMTDGSLEKSVDVMIVKSGGGRYEQPETSTLVINDNNSPIHLDESIANPKMYEGLISSVEFSDDVSNKHDAVLEDSVAVIVTAEGQQLKYDEGVTPHVYGDVLTLDGSSKKHYYADESVYDGGTPYKESNHSSDETTEATSLKFSVGSVETSSATAIKDGGGGTQGFEHGSFYKSAVAEGGSEEFIVYRYVYGDDSVEESKYVGYMDMHYLEDPTVYMSDYVIEVPEIEQGTVLTQSETFSEHDPAVTLFYSHESDNTVRGILSPIKELSPIDEFGQVVSVWWGSKDVLDLMETKGYGEYDDGLDTTESSGIVYGLYEGFDTSQDSVKLGDIEESTQGFVQMVSYIVDDASFADDVYYGSEQEEQELALLLRHGSEPSGLIKGDMQYVEGLEDDVESTKSLDVGLIVFFEKPNIERKVEASLDTSSNGNSLRHSYNSDSVELFNSLWMGSRPQILEGSNDFRIGVGRDGMSTSLLRKEGSGALSVDEVGNYKQGSSEDVLERTSYFTKGHSSDGYNVSEKRQEEGAVLPPTVDAIGIGGGGETSGFELSDGHKEGVKSDEFGSFSSYVQGSQESDLGSFKNTATGEEEKNLIMSDTVIEGNYPVKAEQLRKTSIEGVESNQEISDSGLIVSATKDDLTLSNNFKQAHAADNVFVAGSVLGGEGVGSLESSGSYLNSEGYNEYDTFKPNAKEAERSSLDELNILGLEGHISSISTTVNNNKLGELSESVLSDISYLEGSAVEQFASPTGFVEGNQEDELSEFNGIVEGYKEQTLSYFESIVVGDNPNIKVAAISYSEGKESLLESSTSFTKAVITSGELFDKVSVEADDLSYEVSKDSVIVNGVLETGEYANNFKVSVGLDSVESFNGIKESIGYEEYSEAKSLFSGFIPMLHVMVEKRHVEGLLPINGERASGYQEAKEPHRLESHNQTVNSDDVVSLELFVGYLDGGNELIKLSLSDVVVQGGGVERLSLSDVTVLGRDKGDNLDLSTTSREGYVIGVDGVDNVNSEGFVFGYEETSSNAFFGIYDDLSLPQYSVRQADVDKQIASDGNVVVFGTAGNELSSVKGYKEGKESYDTETANTFMFAEHLKDIDHSVVYMEGGSSGELDKTEKSQTGASIVAYEVSTVSPYIGDKPHDLDKGGTYRYAGKGVSIESSDAVSEGVDTRGNEQVTLNHFDGLVSTQVDASKQGVEGDLPRYLENPRKHQLSSILIPMESSYSSVYEYGDIDLFVGMFNVLGIEIFEYDTVDTTKFAGVVDGLEETDTSVVSLGIVDEQSVSSSQTTSYGNLVEYDKVEKLYIIGDVAKLDVPEIPSIRYGSVDGIEATTDEKFFFGVVLKAGSTDSGIVRYSTLDLADGAEYRGVYLADMLASDVVNYRNHYQADLVGVSVSDKYVIGDNSPELSDGDLIYRLSDISVGESATVTVGGEGELYRLDTVSTEDEKEVELHWGTYGFKGENEQDVVVEDVDTVNKVDNTLDLIVDGEDMAIRITDVLDIHLDRKSVSAMRKEEILDVSTESMDNGIKLEVTFDTLLSNAVRGVRQEATMDTDVSDIEVFDILDPVLDVHVGDHEFAHKNEVVLNTVVEDIELVAREDETFDVSLHLTEKSLRQDYDVDVAVDLQELANSIDRMFDVSVEVTEYGDKNEGALDVYVELHDVATKDEVADTVVDKGVMAAGAERTPDVEVHSFDMSEQFNGDKDVDVFIPTTAELEKEDDVVLEFSGTAETTRTDDILLESQDVAYGDNSRDVVLESTSTADSGRTSDVVVELPDMATGGNSYDVVITLSENGVTNASSDVVVEDVQKAIANAGVDVNIEGISLASADGTRDVTVELPELADSNDHAYDVEFVVHDLAITDKTDDVLVESTDFASTDTTTDVDIELPDFATTSDAVRDVAIETQDLAETDITTDVVVGVAELAELHKTDDVAIDGTDFGTSEKDVDVVVEETVTADSDSHVDVSIEYGDMADSYEDVDVTIETPVLAGQDSTTDTVIEDIDLADSNSSADVVIDSEVLAESGNEHDVVIEDFDFADSSQEVDAVVETPEMADSSETADTVIEEPEMATSENTSDVVVDDTELAEPSNTFHDVIVEDFTPSTRGRKRLLDLMEEEEFEPVGDRLIDIYEEEEVTSGGSTIMILEEEELAEPTTTSYISIEDDELADRTHSSLLEIDEDEETRPTSTKGIVIEDDEQVTKYKSLNDITIEGEEEGHREREFGVTIDFEDEGAKLGREFPIDIDDDDPGIGLPPTNPPWEEPQPKGKIWLIMGKPFPAWNGWNNKKTR
jgi:hypothetical protein